MKKKFLGLAMCTFLLLGSVPAYADVGPLNSDQAVNSGLVISTKETSVIIPSNVTISSIRALDTSSITYDHSAGISWDKGERQVWGNTQAKQGDTKLDSYTRARFEHTWYQGGSIYGDSGRVWRSNKGRSYAYSDWETFNSFNSGVANTYYGI